MSPPDRPWLVIATRSRGNRPGVSMSWLKRPCRTRADGRAWVEWLRAQGWYAGVELDPAWLREPK